MGGFIANLVDRLQIAGLGLGAAFGRLLGSVQFGQLNVHGHPSHQFVERARFNQVIIHALVEEFHPLVNVVDGREDDDRQVGRLRPTAKSVVQIQSTDSGQHQIEQNKVGSLPFWQRIQLLPHLVGRISQQGLVAMLLQDMTHQC